MTDKTSLSVTAATVREWLDNNEPVTVIDVRSPAEYETAHIRGSVNVPLPLIEEHAGQLGQRLDPSVILVCQSGKRSSKAQAHLAQHGMHQTQVLDGGVPDYQEIGGDIVHGRPRWAMERQVRLVAGSLVTGSTALSALVPKARFLAGAIGAGLTVAAITDTCAMANTLSKLPYNRGAKHPTIDEVSRQISAQRIV